MPCPRLAIFPKRRRGELSTDDNSDIRKSWDMIASASPSFIAALHSDRPAADRAQKMGLYGWLIGRWEMDGVIHDDDGRTHTGRGEIHFGWVLGGRAIQDVWIMPRFFYGTTLRVYDPDIDAWHILWSDPLKQRYRRQIGRAHGDDIVQEGNDDTGAAVRWSFTEITPSHSVGAANTRPMAAPIGSAVD